MKLKKYFNDISELNTNDNYSYEYWDGTRNSMILSDNNGIYGNTRKGYKEFRNNNRDCNISYSDKVSLRTVSKDHKIIGYITETKKSNTPIRDKAKEIFEKAKYEFIKKLNIKDIESVEYYLDIIFENDFVQTVDVYRSNINKMLNIIDEYNTDDDFRNFFNKIKD